MKKNLIQPRLKKLKDKLKENNALTKAGSFIFLILIIAGLFTFITLGLRSYDLFFLPPFLENLFFGGDDGDEQPRTDDSDMYDYLNSEALENGGFDLKISLENVRGIISSINLPDNLHLETTVKYYKEGQVSRIEEISLWKKEKKYKYTLKSNGKSEEIYINDGKSEFIENSITRSSTRRSANENFSFESVPHIKDINYYLDLIESGRITDFEIKRNIEENIMIINYIIKELDQNEVIQISLDTGIVLRVESFTENGTILYYESITSVKEAYFTGFGTENTSLTEDIFVIK